MNCYHNVGSICARQIRRQVVHQGAIHIHAVSVAHGRENRRQRHGRPHSKTDRAIVEDMGFSRNQLG